MENSDNIQISNGKTNGSGPWLGTTGVGDNPFISPRIPQGLDEAGPAKAAEETPINEATLPPAVTEQKRNPKRKALLFFLTGLSLLCMGLALYAMYGGKKSIDYRIADRQKAKPEQRVQSGTGMEEGATNQINAEAIQEAKADLRKGGEPAEPAVAPSATPSAATQNGPRATASTGQIFTPYIVPDAPASSMTRGTTAETSTGRGGEQAGDEPTGGRSAQGTRNTRQTSRGTSPPAAHSIYVVAPESRGKAFTSNILTPMRAPALESRGLGSLASSAGVTVPSFGAMLPVRTLGAVYTLRQGSLARFELTRDMTGAGWALKRGTVLVAQQQGSEHDRAFLTLMGFIDPETNRLVRLSGDLLGGDAAPGLKGKRRRISSRWTGVFNRVANSAVALGQAALSRGNSTTIVVPGAGIGSEFGLSQSTLTRREFVEVPAGAPAYVLVTDLPKETRGIDAEPVKDGDDFLADEELAELLASGDPEQIRAALPRMQPEMRKVAMLVLGEKGK